MIIAHYIFSFILYVIKSAICYVFCDLFLSSGEHSYLFYENKKRSFYLITLHCTISGALLWLGNHLIDRHLYLNFFTIAVLLLIQFVYVRRKFFIILFSTLFYMVIIDVINFFMSYLVKWLTRGLSDNFDSHTVTIISSDITLLFTMLILIFLFSLEYVVRSGRPHYSTTILCYIGNIILAIIFVLCFFAIHIFKIYGITENNYGYFLFLFALFLLFIYIFALISVLVDIRYRAITAELNTSINMMKQSEDKTKQLFQLWRTSIHDYKHKLFVIDHWVEENNIEELKKFIKSENKLLSNQPRFIHTGNDYIDALINSKKNHTDTLNIRFDADVDLAFKHNIDDMDLISLLGNLIDNAIEACIATSDDNPASHNSSDDSYVKLKIKRVKNFLYVKVVNSYSRPLPKNLKTTKKDSDMHGIGLKSVEHIINHYHGNYQINNTSNTVMITVMLPIS